MVNVHDIVGRDGSRAVESMTLVFVGQVVPLRRCVLPELLQEHEILSYVVFTCQHAYSSVHVACCDIFACRLYMLHVVIFACRCCL